MKNSKKQWLAVLAGFFALCSACIAQDLNQAIINGDVASVRGIVQENPDLLNKKNADYLTPLNLAAEQGKLEVARVLLSLGADPAIGDKENSQPVHLAAINGDIPLFDLLISFGVNTDARDDNQMTPLLFAASRGQLEMARHIVDLGADTKAKNINGFNGLLMAAIGGNIDLVKMFVESGAQVNAKNYQGFTSLHSAASYGRTEIVKFLVDKGADINAETLEGEQPLALAQGRNSYSAAKYLIDQGAEVNHKSNDGFSALHNVAGRGNIAIAQLLIDNGADVNAATTGGIVPLTYAAFADNAGEMGKLLILNGANINPDPCKDTKNCTCGPNFRTPLHAASEAGRTDLIEALVSCGARVNIYDNSGLTPLHYAVKSGNLDAVSFLVDKGAFLNVPDKETGCTELHMAAGIGYGDIAGYLMEHGSCTEVKDNAGKTPLDYAFYYGQNRIGYSMLAQGSSDSSLADYILKDCLLTQSVERGEAEVIFLGHSGWAIKTQNHFLVLDYFDNPRARKPDNPCLKSGCINAAELAGLKMDVFSTHDHSDHYNKSIFDWDDNQTGIEYILCFEPAGISNDFTYIPVNQEAEVDDMRIYVNKSTDQGGGYLIEVDGLVIFHMGDHANGTDGLSEEFTREIDLIAEKNKNIDILFAPIRGCSLGSPEQVRRGVYYTLEKLHPALFVPMHSGLYSAQYKLFTDQAQSEGIKLPMKYMTGKGDRFFFKKGEQLVVNKSEN